MPRTEKAPVKKSKPIPKQLANMSSALKGKTGKFKIFYDRKGTTGKVLVVSVENKPSLSEVTKRLGTPVGSAMIDGDGIVKLGGMSKFRCLG